MQHSVNPAKQNVQIALQNRVYHVDFYQREYVWPRETVETFLNDIFFSFETSYTLLKDSDLTSELINKYNWYYINTIITNTIDGKNFIVDGQQRLSTLTLIAVKLFHLTKSDGQKQNLKACITGQDVFNKNIYYLDSEKRKRAMDFILNGTEFTGKYANKTEETIIERYKEISKYIDNKEMNDDKLMVFVVFFLQRLVLVELNISQDDTPMVFEVINDRGVALRPFEILKGKLIGILDKNDTSRYVSFWDNTINKLTGLEDSFFVDYLKSKFVFKRNSSLEIDINNAYHRYIFENNDISKSLAFRKSDDGHIKNIKNFIEVDLTYYGNLYQKINTSAYEYIKYNRIHNLSGQYNLILSACNINDCEEDAKIETISKEFDRLHMLLRLNQAYDSNSFQEISYGLHEKIKDVPLAEYRQVFDMSLREAINDRLGYEVSSLLSKNSFLRNDYSNMNTRILRYFLARIEKFLCDRLNQQMQYTVEDISTKTSHKTGFHIEHILSRNATNKAFFASEDEFENKRNLLGGLLLLRGRDNLSSGNEEYADKLSTYCSGLVWGHTLSASFYHNNNAMNDFNNELSASRMISINAIQQFDENALDYRNDILFELTKIIWEV